MTTGTNDEFSVHGVVTPISAAVRPGALAHQYETDNAIDSIRYEITNATGEVVQASTGATGLHRRYDPVAAPGSVSTSVYEFAHELRLQGATGT